MRYGGYARERRKCMLTIQLWNCRQRTIKPCTGHLRCTLLLGLKLGCGRSRFLFLSPLFFVLDDVILQIRLDYRREWCNLYRALTKFSSYRFFACAYNRREHLRFTRKKNSAWSTASHHCAIRDQSTTSSTSSCRVYVRGIIWCHDGKYYACEEWTTLGIDENLVCSDLRNSRFSGMLRTLSCRRRSMSANRALA